MVCEKCGHEMPDGEEYCQFCGFKVTVSSENEEKAKKNSSKDKLIVIAIIAVFFIIIGIYVIQDAVEKKRRDEEISKAMQQVLEETKEIVEDFEKDADEITKH